MAPTLFKKKKSLAYTTRAHKIMVAIKKKWNPSYVVNSTMGCISNLSCNCSAVTVLLALCLTFIEFTCLCLSVPACEGMREVCRPVCMYFSILVMYTNDLIISDHILILHSVVMTSNTIV